MIILLHFSRSDEEHSLVWKGVMVVIVLHYSWGTFHWNVLLNGCKCVIAGVKTNEFVCYVRLAVFAEEELQLGFMYL